MNKVLIIDTSMLCCWLQVPGKETCGTTEDQWDFQRVNHEIQEEIAAGSTLVLPLATIIETGNHIAQANGDRFSIAQQLAALMNDAADMRSPWAAFTDQSVLWEKEGLKRLAEELPQMATQKISIGDVTIKTVADHYAKIGSQVEIFTGDAGLKSYQPSIPIPQPRRRKK
ncbi:hypothetical protein CBW65_02910 [Tumebacillus avium]|uniref:PIN domain-containing protein n=1 Tax=Tumebacillus avium TaxID=1903704 RepID=A0A1Y0IL73_9BACL|nr:hypothetical protein [Tumebacillus avium]ARU60124.1 hypothetical protein CBW65_02910 [Tumebacillus avium]